MDQQGQTKSALEQQAEFAALLRQVADQIESDAFMVESFIYNPAPSMGDRGFVQGMEPRWTLSMTYSGVRGTWAMDPDGKVGWLVG